MVIIKHIFIDLELKIFQSKLKSSEETKIPSKNIYRIQAHNSMMCGYLFIRFIEFMLKGKSFLDDTNLFSPNEYEKNDKIIQKYFH